MAIQAGVVMRNGSQVPDSLGRIFRDRMQSYAPDQLYEMRAAGYLVLHGARSWAGRQESWREAPANEADSVVFFDGRLDNREDLVLSYFSSQERGRQLSDSEIVGRVVAVGGTRALVECLGDWSVALIRTSTHTVILASEGMGTRPLYYAKTAFGVVWSTDLGTVTAAAGVGSSDLDPEYFAGFLAALPPPLTVPYKGVCSVRPGAALTMEANGHAKEEIWWAPWQVPLKTNHPADSALEFLALWKQVVKDRVPRTAPALFELSGGFDSSSIICMAASLRTSDAEYPALHTVSRVYPNEPAWNDVRFVQAVIDQSGCVPHFLDLSALPAGRVLFTPVPDGPHGVDLANAVLMQDIGARTLVSGRKGDLIMHASALNTSVVTASICDRRVLDTLRDATAVARATRLSAWRVLRDACQPFRAGYSGRMPILVEARKRGNAARPENLVKPALARAVDEKWTDIYRSCRATAPARRGLACELARLTHTRVLEPPVSQANLFHTHPFLDRRVVSFVLEHEPRVMAGAGESRTLMKKALRGVLPEASLGPPLEGVYRSHSATQLSADGGAAAPQRSLGARRTWSD